MALGGGTFITQNKKLPGSYINFVSTVSSGAALGERGYIAAPLNLDWGAEKEVITVTSGDFEKNALKIFGYDYTAAELKPIRDLFKGASTCYFYRVSGGEKASCALGTAKYGGKKGNDLKIVIRSNVDESEKKDVITYLGDAVVDSQTVAKAEELADNDFIVFTKSGSLDDTPGTALENGTTTQATGQTHQDFLSAIEGYSFNILVCDATEDTIKGLYASFTERLRDSLGVKFQTVVYNYDKADYEGVINLTTAAEEGETALVWWVSGVQAGCEINKSLTNRIYNGEYTPVCKETQTALEASITKGEFKLHKVGTFFRVLTDINSLVTLTSEKGELFKSNQTIRVCDQIAMDIAALFNNNYLGIMPNDAMGRVALWSDIVKYMRNLESIRTIENFNENDVSVEQGDTKRSVVVTLPITVVNAMEQLYMTVTVN